MPVVMMASWLRRWCWRGFWWKRERLFQYGCGFFLNLLKKSVKVQSECWQQVPIDGEPDIFLMFHYAVDQSFGMAVHEGQASAMINGMEIRVHGKSSHWCEAHKELTVFMRLPGGKSPS